MATGYTVTDNFGLCKRLRWRVYNYAFAVFGKTPLWPRLGNILWN